MDGGTDLLVAQRKKQFAHHLLSPASNSYKAAQRIADCRPFATTVDFTPPATVPSERAPATLITQTPHASSWSPMTQLFQALLERGLLYRRENDYEGNRIQACAPHRESSR